MKTTIPNLTAAILAGLLVGSAPGDAKAQNPTHDDWRLIEHSEALTLVLEGHRLEGERDFSAARKQYQAAADLLRAQNLSPGPALHHIAEAYYHEGKYQRAVVTLDALASEAAEYGDLVSEAWAMADAAWILARDCESKQRAARGRFEIERRLTKLYRLLNSPLLPAEIRISIEEGRGLRLTQLAGK